MFKSDFNIRKTFTKIFMLLKRLYRKIVPELQATDRYLQAQINYINLINEQQQEQIDQLISQVDVLESDMLKVKNDIIALKIADESILSILDAVMNHISTLQSAVTNNTNDITVIKADIEVIYEAIYMLENAIEIHEIEFDEVYQQIQKILNTINSLVSCSCAERLTNVETNLVALDERIRAIEEASVGVGYRVTYDGNGATEGTPPLDLNSYEKGDLVTILGQLDLYASVEGYASSFAGWSLEKVDYQYETIGADVRTYTEGDSIEVEGSITLYAVWVLKKAPELPNTGDGEETYQVVYNENRYYASTDGQIPVDGNTYTASDTITLLDADLINTTATTEATFVGWVLQSATKGDAGARTTYDMSDVVKSFTVNNLTTTQKNKIDTSTTPYTINVYAVWIVNTVIPSYTITFDPNTAQSNNSDMIASIYDKNTTTSRVNQENPVTVLATDKFILPVIELSSNLFYDENGASIGGALMIGWTETKEPYLTEETYTKANDLTIYDDGVAYNVEKDVTLYALWLVVRMG